jgi:formiminoglutamase
MSKLDTSYKWSGRKDSEESGSGARVHQIINSSDQRPDFSLLGFCCDIGVTNNQGRAGAKAGPNAIRSALANHAWHLDRTFSDAGNIVDLQNLEEGQNSYAAQMARSIQEGAFVLGIGGGHEIALASYRGLEKSLGNADKPAIGIINFDAHFDLRNPKPLASSGTPFRQIAEHCKQSDKDFNYACIGVAETANTTSLFTYAKQHKVKYLLDTECQFDNIRATLSPMLKEIDHLYVTICLDAFPAYIAPGVSAPSSLGIHPAVVIQTLHWLAQSEMELGFKWQIADIAETNPNYDIDNRTAKLAARLINEIFKAKQNS